MKSKQRSAAQGEERQTPTPRATAITNHAMAAGGRGPRSLPEKHSGVSPVLSLTFNTLASLSPQDNNGSTRLLTPTVEAQGTGQRLLAWPCAPVTGAKRKHGFRLNAQHLAMLRTRTIFWREPSVHGLKSYRNLSEKWEQSNQGALVRGRLVPENFQLQICAFFFGHMHIILNIVKQQN